MINRIAKLISMDKKLRALFSGMVSTGILLASLIITAGVFYL